jgi:hypothetical protein
MDNNNLPISDWSEIGRQNYINENRYVVELIISRACEDFDEVELSKYLRSQDDAIESIIQLFQSSKFNHEKLPPDIPENINLFSQLNFWIKFKTGRSSGSIKNQSLSSSEYVEKATESTGKFISDEIEVLAGNTAKLSKLVASDIITYWLMANKKLLDELSPENSSVTEILASPPQKTRYKADAAFRYLCLFCGIDKHFTEYGRKYLTKGSNVPQYVSEGSETHQSKHQVRQSIKKIVQKFYEINSQIDDDAYLIRALLKGIAKNAVLDVYEINKSDSDRMHLEKMLKSLKHRHLKGISNAIK